jgi:phage terminase large subunit-like protein
MRLPIESWVRLIRAELPDLPSGEIEAFCDCWSFFGRADQKPPGPPPKPVWLVLGGRGAGKTRTGAEWVKGMALGQPPFASGPTERIALVGETQGQVRDVMVEGVSGLLAIHTRWERPVWSPSLRRLKWPNGAIAQAFSAEDPEGLRGPQFGAAWSDELAKWPNLQECWDMLQFGLRLGERPRQVATTTPRPVPLIKRLLADPHVAVTSVIREVDPAVPVTAVRATRGKYLRAEPVAALYAQGRVRHVGAFPALEDELCDFGPGGLSSGRSPDRLDALVWALTHLMLMPRTRPPSAAKRCASARARAGSRRSST